MHNETPEKTALSASPAPAVPVPPFEFDRYINGEMMAEGVTIELQTTVEGAARAAARIASRGQNGEVPVLILRSALAASPAPAVPVEPVFSGLSKWEGWDQGRLPWSEAKHKDAVCAAVFRSGWSMEDAAALIGFIDRTWGDCTITPPAPAVWDGPEPFGWVSCGIFTKDAETARHWREGGVDYTTVYASPATDLREENERLTYSSTQETECAGCGTRRHTPLRRDEMDGYVCLTCIDNRLDRMAEAETLSTDLQQKLDKAVEDAYREGYSDADGNHTYLDKFWRHSRARATLQELEGRGC